MTDLDRTVEEIEQGDAWDAGDEVVKIEVKRPLDKVIPVRLPSDKWEQIRAEARELGIGPSTLARMWIMARLRSSSAVAPSPDPSGTGHLSQSLKADR